MAWPAFSNRRWIPYNSLLYTQILRKGAEVIEFSVGRAILDRVDVLHLHWPEHHVARKSLLVAGLRTIAFFLLLDWMRLRGTQLVWTAHNLKSHDSHHPRLEEVFWRGLFRRLQGVVHLTETGKEQLIEHRPELRAIPSTITPLGHFRGAYPNDISPADARESLGITPDAEVIAYVGQVRPYKNVPGLVRAFGALKRPNTLLVIAGDIKPGVSVEALQGHNVRLFDRHLEDAELQIFLRSATLVVIPFRHILNSASALLALSFDRPVLLPNLGTMAELQQNVGTDWVQLFEGEITAGTLAAALEWAGRPRTSVPNLSQYEWERIGDDTFAFYQRLYRVRALSSNAVA